MKKQEKRYVSRINELEEKAEKHQKTESIVKSLKQDIPKIEDNVYLKLSEMENSFRHQQQLSEEAAKVSLQIRTQNCRKTTDFSILASRGRHGKKTAKNYSKITKKETS